MARFNSAIGPLCALVLLTTSMTPARAHACGAPDFKGMQDVAVGMAVTALIITVLVVTFSSMPSHVRHDLPPPRPDAASDFFSPSAQTRFAGLRLSRRTPDPCSFDLRNPRNACTSRPQLLDPWRLPPQTSRWR